MKERNKSKFLTCAAVLIVGLSVFASARTLAASTTQFKLLNGYVIVILVTVNGAGPFEFVLDTGSNTTLICAEFARELRLRPIDRVKLVTVTGSQAVPRTQLESLSVGAKTVKNLEALFSDLREVRAVRSEIRGVLGMNFLAQFNFLINYRERRIEFEDEDEFEKSLRGARLSMEWDDGRTLINSAGKEGLRLVLDSGTSTLILFNSSERPLGLNLDQGEPQALHARSDLGSQIVRQKRLRRLSVGGANFYDLPVALMGAKIAREDRIEDGLLPTSLFQRVYFNHRKKFVTLNPK
ncbi:MAG TPA: aspartyl protease family protein [Blastocatellia bacterium]|nr:aspartyl protease family protein [Blastocatellia bacterium]